ncbi:MAG: hypothetical protein ACRENB_16635, partial [Gemmatimonadales bacterium]
MRVYGGTGLLLAVLSLQPCLLNAQADTAGKARPVVLDPLTVTAERRPVRATSSASTVRVVERGEVARRATSDLTQILGEIP